MIAGRWKIFAGALILIVCAVSFEGAAAADSAASGSVIGISGGNEGGRQDMVASPVANVTNASEVSSDRELSVYELTAAAVSMQFERAKARAESIGSASIEFIDLMDPASERASLEGILRSHAAVGDIAGSRNRLESIRLDQKLMSSKRQIIQSKLVALESRIPSLTQEKYLAGEELAECMRLKDEHERRLKGLDQAVDSMNSAELVARKKATLSELIQLRNEYIDGLRNIMETTGNQIKKVNENVLAAKSAVSVYNEYIEKIGVIIRQQEDSVKKMTIESAAQEAKDAADSARREIEVVDQKIALLDKDLVGESTSSESDIFAKYEKVARRDLLLSQKDALTEQVRLQELRGRAVRDNAQFEEIEQRASPGDAASGSILVLGKKDWLPRLDQVLADYQNAKSLVVKRLELLMSTRQIINQSVSESERSKGKSGKKVELTLKKQQLSSLQQTVQTLNEQKSAYDALIKQAFSARQVVQGAIESELERKLFARSRFRARTGLIRSLTNDISALPAAVTARITAAARLLNIGLVAQLLLTAFICFGAAWAGSRLNGTMPGPGEASTLLQLVTGHAFAIAGLVLMFAVSWQLEPAAAILAIPIALLATLLISRLIERTLLMRLPEDHALRGSLIGILRVLAIGVPPIVLLRWFGVYREIAFLINQLCKISLIWPLIRLIHASAPFGRLLQENLGLQPESKLLRITVFAFKFIAVLNLVCLLTALYGYKNFAAFVFLHSIEGFSIIMLITVGKPLAGRLAVRLFDPANGIATSYVSQERAQFLLFISRKILLSIVYLVAAVAIASMAGITTESSTVRFILDWLMGQSDWLLARIGRIVIIIGAIALVLEFVQTLGESVIAYVKNEDRSSLTENERRASTLVQIMNTSARVVLFCIGGIMILRELGMDITPLLTGAGIVGVAIGFGSQSLVKDFFAGFFILVENQFRVGDVVEIGGRSGSVEKINLKTTVLRAMDGSVFIIPNGEITSVKNMTYTWSRAVLDIGVSYEADLDKALELLQSIGDELASDPKLASDIWGRPEVLGVENLDSSSVVLRMLVKTRPLTQWHVSRLFRKRIKEDFDKAGIEIPFPQQVVTLRADPELMKIFMNAGKPES